MNTDKTKLRDKRLVDDADEKNAVRPNQRNTKYSQRFAPETPETDRRNNSKLTFSAEEKNEIKAEPDNIKSKNKQTKMQHDADTVGEKLKKAQRKAGKTGTNQQHQSGGKFGQQIRQAGASVVHRKISEAEDENFGTKAAHKTELAAEQLYGAVGSAYRFARESPARNSSKLEKRSMNNMPVKGKVTIEKTGEMLAGSIASESEFGDIYTPVYEVRGLSGATFDIIAAEDIITPDETIRAAEGTVVDTITTGANGKATSKELYLGNYIAVETDVPYGFIIDETPLTFSLMYEDQETALVSAETGIYNDRAKAEISLFKQKEIYQNDKLGNTTYTYVPAAGIVFGLFAQNDITDVAGNMIIPADSLVELLVTGEDGMAASTCDIPLGEYYVKELATEKGYILKDDIYPVSFEYADAETPVVNIPVNGGDAILNDYIRGRIKVVKMDEDQQPLSGVEFLIAGLDNTIMTTLITDENGEAETGLLPVVS